MNPVEYSPDALTRLVRDDLEGWDAPQAAKVSIAKDPWHVLEILADSPRGLRFIVHWAGEEALGEEPAAPLETQRVEVIVAFALGLRSTPDAALVENQPDRPSLLKTVAAVKRRVLEMQFAADASEGLFRYRGTEPVETPEGVPLAAYRLRFELDTAMDDLQGREV